MQIGLSFSRGLFPVIVFHKLVSCPGGGCHLFAYATETRIKRRLYGPWWLVIELDPTLPLLSFISIQYDNEGTLVVCAEEKIKARKESKANKRKKAGKEKTGPGVNIQEVQEKLKARIAELQGGSRPWLSISQAKNLHQDHSRLFETNHGRFLAALTI